MFSDYRAFGECVKVVLGTSGAIDLTQNPQTTTNGNFSSKYSYMHLVTLGDASFSVGFAFNLDGAITYDLVTTGQVQVPAVNYVSVASGQVLVLLFA